MKFPMLEWIYKRIKKIFGLKPLIFILLILAVYRWGLIPTGVLTIPQLKVKSLFIRLGYKLSKIPESSKDIVILAFDTKTCDTLRITYPLDRNVYADLLNRLTNYSPKVVGLNFAFLARTPEGDIYERGDYEIANALKNAGNVILPSHYTDKEVYYRPHNLFSENAMAFGYSNKIMDKDDTVRYVPIGGMDFPFELKIACAFMGIPFENISYDEKIVELRFPPSDIYPDRVIRFTVKNRVLPLKYTVKEKDLKIVPVLDFFEGQIPTEVFKDKIVLVGLTCGTLKGHHNTPLGRMPEEVVMANEIIMFLDQDFIMEFPNFLNVLVLLIFGIGTGIILLRVGVLNGFFLSSLSIVIFGIISVILVRLNFWWDFGNVPFLILLMYPIVNFYRYAQLFMETLTLKKIAITDTLTGLYTYRYYQLKLHNDLRKAVKNNRPLAVVLFEIIGLEQITASLGSERVDKVIEELAKLIRNYSRKTRGVDIIGRYKENGFGVILHSTTQKGAMSYAQRICRTVADRRFLGDEKVQVSLSAGISAYPDIETGSSTALIMCGESALLRTRTEPKGGVCVYDTGIDKVPLEECKPEEELGLETGLSYVARDLEEKNRELVEAIGKLRSAHEDIIKMERVSAMGKLTAQIHHELNNPLQNMGSFLETVKKRRRWDSEVEEFVGLALKEVERMKKLSQEMRDFYKPIRKEMEDIDLNIILDDMLKMSKAQLESSNIRLVKQFDAHLPEVKGNKEELKQVFLNMIINATESMNKGGTLTVITLVTAEKIKGLPMVEVVIRDTGCGIPPENIEKIFKPFFTTKGDTRGTGLGLYACSEIVKRHSGTIDVESKINEGASFIIRLPMS